MELMPFFVPRLIGPDGKLYFTVGDAGIPVWRAAAAGGPVAGSGTYASRPASPSLGDTYTVTSGARTGSVYRCDVAGAWVLSRVLPLISTATGR